MRVAVASIPVAVAWCVTGTILNVLGIEASLAHDVGIFMRYMIAGLVPAYAFECLRKYLQVHVHLLQVNRHQSSLMPLFGACAMQRRDRMLTIDDMHMHAHACLPCLGTRASGFARFVHEMRNSNPRALLSTQK
jgi:hypothetical protein